MWRTMTGLRGRTRRWWTMGTVVVVLAALVVVAVTGTREPASAVRFVPGTAWLEDAATGAVSHVFGYSATSEAPVPTGSARDPFTVVQEADGAYVLDQRTGVLRRLGGTSIGVATQRTLTGSPSGLRVLTTGTTTWSVDTSSGIAQQLNPTSLAPVGHQVPIGAALGDVITDTSGTLWAVVPSRGAVAKVQPGGGLDNIDVGRVGDQVQLADTQNGVWAVDGSLHEMLPIDGQRANPAPLPSTTTHPVVASSPTSPQLLAVTGDTATDLDTGNGAVTQTSSPGLTGVAQGVIANDQAYLLAPAQHAVDIFGLDPAHAETTVQVPAGANQLVAQDQMVFVNASNTPDAAVIDRDGKLTPILKYHAPTKAPGNQPAPVTATAAAPPVPGPGTDGTGAPGPTPTKAAAPPVPATPTPTTTAPLLPAVPTDVAGHGSTAGQLQITWQPGAGGAPVASYQILLSPSAGGAAFTQTTAGTSATFTGLAHGASYCPSVQAISATGVGSGYRAGPCTDSAVSAPTTAPTLSVLPARDGVDVTIGAAASVDPGTTYAATINGTTTNALPPGTSFVAVPNQPANSDDLYTNVTVTATATNNAGHGPSSASVSSFVYGAGSAVSCLNTQTGSIGDYAVGTCDGTDEQQGHTDPWATVSTIPPGAPSGDPNTFTSIPMGQGDEVLCSYYNPNAASLVVGERLIDDTKTKSCPTLTQTSDDGASAGETGTFYEIVWSTPTSTHTVPVNITEVTIPAPYTGAGKQEDLFCGADMSLQTCADGVPVTNPTRIATFYADPAP